MYKQSTVTTGLKKSFKNPQKQKPWYLLVFFLPSFENLPYAILDYRLLKNCSVIELVHVFYWFNNMYAEHKRIKGN